MYIPFFLLLNGVMCSSVAEDVTVTRGAVVVTQGGLGNKKGVPAAPSENPPRDLQSLVNQENCQPPPSAPQSNIRFAEIGAMWYLIPVCACIGAHQRELRYLVGVCVCVCP